LPLPLEGRFNPLGFPLKLATNSDAVIHAAQESWSVFERRFDTPAVELRVAVGEKGSEPLRPPTFRAQQHLLAINANAENFAVCDLARGFAFCSLTEDAASDAGYMRLHFLEAMAYCSLTALCLTGIHAACISLRGRGLLLCGRTGAGKTSLAYACAQQGFTLISDDATLLVRGRDDLLALGKPHRIRFRHNARTLFPEFAAFGVADSPNGKPTIEIETRKFPSIRTAFECHISFVIMLERGSASAAGLVPIRAEDARTRLLRELPFLTPDSYREQLQSLDRLARCPAFELRYTHLEEAVNALEELVRGEET
jgi:hypothetical protein